MASLLEVLHALTLRCAGMHMLQHLACLGDQHLTEAPDAAGGDVTERHHAGLVLCSAIKILMPATSLDDEQEDDADLNALGADWFSASSHHELCVIAYGAQASWSQMVIWHPRLRPMLFPRMASRRCCVWPGAWLLLTMGPQMPEVYARLSSYALSALHAEQPSVCREGSNMRQAGDRGRRIPLPAIGTAGLCGLPGRRAEQQKAHCRHTESDVYDFPGHRARQAGCLHLDPAVAAPVSYPHV